MKIEWYCITEVELIDKHKFIGYTESQAVIYYRSTEVTFKAYQSFCLLWLNSINYMIKKNLILHHGKCLEIFPLVMSLLAVFRCMLDQCTFFDPWQLTAEATQTFVRNKLFDIMQQDKMFKVKDMQIEML